MTELMDGGKNWLIPPSTITTPTAMLTSRLDTWISLNSPPPPEKTRWDPGNGNNGENIQDVREVHFDDV
jgi:hypothetical protein